MKKPCGSHVVSQMLVAHVRLPQFACFLVLIEHKMRRVHFVLVQVVVDTASFRERRLNEFEKLWFHEVDLPRPSVDVGNDSEL